MSGEIFMEHDREIWQQCDTRFQSLRRPTAPRRTVGSIWDVKVGFEIPGYGALLHGGFSVAHYSAG